MILNGLKRSGESLSVGATRPGQPWTKQGREQTVEHLDGLGAYLREQNKRRRAGGAPILGAIVVIGAGNGGLRGDILVEDGMDPVVADQIGLNGTAMNAHVVRTDLERKGVPHRALMAGGVDIGLPEMKRFDVCTPEAIAEAAEEDLFVLIGGGSAELGQSTDGAIMSHLKAFRDSTGAKVRAYKGTKFSGVYDADPAINPDAQLLSSVSTQQMRDNGWTAIDAVSLNLIDSTGIPMYVHNINISPAEALGGRIGTTIMPHVVSTPAASLSS